MDIINDKNERGISAEYGSQTYEACCPFLGLKNDRATALGYPDNRNQCHHHDLAVPVAWKRQVEYCLTNKYIACGIFLQEELEDANSRKFAHWLKLSARLALLVPVILIVIAAIVWWPVPGTSIEEFTSSGAPQRKLVVPAEIDQPPLFRSIRAAKVEVQSTTTKPQLAIDAVNIKPIPATATPASKATSPIERSTENYPGGFRIHIYK